MSYVTLWPPPVQLQPLWSPMSALVEWPMFLKVFVFESVTFITDKVSTQDIKIMETGEVDIRGSWSGITSKTTRFKTQGAPGDHNRAWRGCLQTAFSQSEESVIVQISHLITWGAWSLNCSHASSPSSQMFFLSMFRDPFLVLTFILTSPYLTLHFILTPHGCFLIYLSIHS